MASRVSDMNYFLYLLTEKVPAGPRVRKKATKRNDFIAVKLMRDNFLITEFHLYIGFKNYFQTTQSFICIVIVVQLHR